ncbi:hypothetical protein GK047_24180 [Paenibacillus sp. SYP-B3998]|uniref:PLD phosphodiesterase domain-containing protein n=1 Tax=Paenibacillus sp. SYP-B3998 TaxID=2678564 RepID=A0A6G4A464_9BACL|nr:phospholipase D-like domain-containing protein [Paenibacillus sp. SYP-B3998]NEW09078.1 hypothetical protein [Paenibacillus sp. SYP-B3998]
MTQLEFSSIAGSESPIPFLASGSYPVRHGNRVRPLVDSAPTFRRICEAIEAARHSVWLTITFMSPDFQMPDKRGTLFDVLDSAVLRGLDVRVIFWRPNLESSGYGQAFPGYWDSYPTPGGSPFDISSGERSIFEQYKRAIDAARSSIYIENQALPIPEIAVRLEEALKRGVDVVLLVPAEPEQYVYTFRQHPDRKSFFDQLETLGQYKNFALVGIAGLNGQGGRSNIYVHAKLMMIDDVWATIGSCNLHSNSLFGHTEMNATFWDPKVVRSLRSQLLVEHLGLGTLQLNDREAFKLYRNIAQENQLRGARGDFNWKSLAFSLDPTTYGK